MRLNLYHIVASLSMLLFASFLQAQTPEGFTWQDVRTVDFGSGANHFTIEAASASLGGEVELRLDAADGIVIGRTFFHQTGSTTHFMEYECDLSQTVSGTHDLYMNFLDYAEPKTQKTLNIGDFQFTLIEESLVRQGDSLHVYPPVPGLDPSPYYEIQIQKVSELNSDNLTDVTNWETAFAWFTQCKQDETGYYSHYIGGWSDTYTNFELDPNTPIVVKITRRTDISDGAPSGPITSAAVHPARKVDSCKVINGAVYIIMSNPALVAVDIDGQMDTRKAPRALPTGWGSDSFPYSSIEKGAHSVTIFANPFIEDKPNPDDPGVFVVKAGEKMPDNLDQVSENIIYFEPGIHKASLDVNAQGDLVERNWEEKDIIHLANNKSYFIPGDAIVYGNFRSDDGANIRVYGHGVISGLKIMHFSAFEELGITVDEWKQRGIVIEKAKNCHVEGITMENPGFHTFGFHAETSNDYQPSSITWTKMIGWRPNSDGLSISGNLFVEDCFIRSQDDGIYSGGAKPIRRCVFWHDVNGQTFRGDFMTRRIKNNYPSDMPQQLVAEDIDIIYARGVFNTSDNGFGIIGVGGGSDNETLPDGTENTGQMFIFRNIKISDPLPTRNLLSFDTKDEKDLKYDKKGDYAGIRFENIDYQGKQIFGWRDQLDGSPDAALRNFVFDNVSINGKKIDANYVNDPASCIKNYVSDFTFRSRDTISSTGYVLIRTATNGSIKLENTEVPNKVKVIANPNKGYRFSGWSGDLSASDSIATITMDQDKAITANFSLITYSIDTTATNGTIIFEPAGNNYLPGTEVTVKAVGNLGYGFDAWSGDLQGNDNPITLVMDDNKTISAGFKEAPTYTLGVQPEFGSVVLDPPGGEYNPGTVVTLIPQGDPGYYFEQWIGDLSGSDNPATITLDTDKMVNARFVYAGTGTTTHAVNCGGSDYKAIDGTSYSNDMSGGASYSTNSGISGTEDDQLYQTERYGKNFSYTIPVENGSYQITLMFAEIFHSSAGQRVFNVSIEGEEVIHNLDIYAKAGKNAAYNETHEVTITDGEINIAFTTVTDNAKISAIQINNSSYKGETFMLATNDTSNGVIKVYPAEGPYPAGSNVLLTAIPDTGFMFNSWNGDLTGSDNPSTLYMNGDKNISANFEKIPVYTLTMNVSNGVIELNPAGGSYEEGTVVTVQAVPDNGFAFNGWSGDLSGNENPTTIVMDSDKEIEAEILDAISFTLTTYAENGSIQINPESSTTYSPGSAAILIAIPDEGYVFDKWTGDLSGAQNPTSIIMDEDKTVTAEFKIITSLDEFNTRYEKNVLGQNYPNPFSTKTTIHYQLNEASDVKLSIYNYLGIQIATLVNEYQLAGAHSVTWNVRDEKGEKLAGGLYIYRLETNNNAVQIKKASLVR